MEKTTQKKHLLIMDDDNDFCDFAQSIAEAANYEVLAIFEPTLFQEAYKSFKPDIIFLDLEMPNIDGIELLRLLKTDGCLCPIAIMSGLDEEIILSAHRVGRLHGLHMLSAFKKPIKSDVIAALLQRVVKIPQITSHQLVSAIEKDDFTLFFEPIASLKTKQPIGAEASLHIKKEDGKILSAENFIPLAEDCGLIKKVTLLMIEKTLKECNALQKNSEPFTTSFNLSAKLLTDLHLPDELELLAKSYQITPTSLCLEITETAAMTQPLQAIDILTRFRMKGFLLAVADFGTGFSSLAVLHRMPFTELKIDRTFIKNIPNDQELVPVVHDMITLGKSCGYKITADGVERPETLKMLRDLNCDAVQGHYIASPMRGGQLKEWCDNLQKQDWRKGI